MQHIELCCVRRCVAGRSPGFQREKGAGPTRPSHRLSLGRKVSLWLALRCVGTAFEFTALRRKQQGQTDAIAVLTNEWAPSACHSLALCSDGVQKLCCYSLRTCTLLNLKDCCADITGECSSETAEKVAGQMEKLLEEMHRRLPNTNIIVMAILPKVLHHIQAPPAMYSIQQALTSQALSVG